MPKDMSIRCRTILLLSVSMVIFIGFLAAASYQFVTRRFETLEQDYVETHLATVHSEFQTKINTLETISVDWGDWNDTYEFVIDGNSEYVDSNLNEAALANLNLNFMLFYDINGRLAHQKFISLYQDAPEIDKNSLFSTIQSVPSLLYTNGSGSNTCGILIADSSAYLIASQCITNGYPDSPIRGTYLIGRRLDDYEIEQIGEATQTRVTVNPSNITGSAGNVQSPNNKSSVDAVVERLDSDTVLGHSKLIDLTEKQELLIEIEVTRDIYQQGLATWRQNAFFMISFGGVFIVLLLLILDRSVFNRLSNLAQDVSKLSFSGENLDHLEIRKHDELGKLVESINYMLTEQSRSYSALRENELFLQQMLDAINCGVIVIDPETRTILKVNDTAIKLSERNRGDIIGKVCHNMVCPNDYNQCPVLDFKQPVNLSERKLVKPDGILIPILKSVKAIQHKGKELLVESFIDISSLKKAEKDLFESETRYRRFFEEDITGDVLMNVADRTVIDCNPAFAKMFGHESIEEAMAVNADTHFPYNEGEKLLDRLRKEKKIEHIQLEFIHRDKRPIYCIGNLVGLFDNDGNLTQVRGYYFDDTKRVLLEKDLRKAHKMEAIGTLAGGIAHDFNNILQPILGYTTFLLDDLPEDSLQREYVDRIVNASLRAKNLVKQILAFSRQSPHEMIAVHLQKILKDVISLCRSTIPSNIEINYDFQKDCPAVMADPTQLHQVAMNLIVNAYHAIDQTVGKISVQVRETMLEKEEFKFNPLKPGRYALLSVSDTGCGMDDATIEKIFEPYFTTKEQGKGTGLGLAVVYGIVKEHNGEINAYSEVGKGTTFNVYLPVAKDVSQSAKIMKPKIYQGHQERILLVDDEQIVLDLVANMLKRLNYKAVPFLDSTQALEAFKVTPEAFELVITDMTMPKMTGDLLAERVLEISPNMPIILCTGFSEKISEERARDIGVKNFLEKPITLAELSQKVKQILDGHCD